MPLKIISVKIFFIFFVLSLLITSDYAFAESDALSGIEPGTIISGEEGGDLLSSSAGSGDINGDGIQDIIIGAIGAGPLDRPRAGAVYVFYGSSDIKSDIDLTAAEPDIMIIGADSEDKFGISIASPCGDINGDGIDDLVIGAICADPSGMTDAGSVYVIYGKKEFPKYLAVAKDADVEISGESEYDWLGIVTVGDVNNDGKDDIIMGASSASPGEREKAGKIYVIFGREKLPRNINLARSRVDLEIIGEKEGDRTGWPVMTGDINGDYSTDIIIGVPGASIKGRESAGKVHVIFGKENLKKEIDLSKSKADLSIIGENTGDSFGTLVLTDVNGDSIDDLIVSSPFASAGNRQGAGKIYIIFGKEGFPAVMDLKKVIADVEILGECEGGNLGSSLATCNINADEYGDIAIGAPLADSPEAKNAGATYIISGREDWSRTIDLASSPADYKFYGKSENEQSGTAIVSADLDKDQRSDILIGAVGASPKGQKQAGQVYIIYGDKL